ncbi:MAG: class I SAM-dependent methyltransferase [Chloroflexi bacterium]|nr:class I SAM-dependent methyltransferase [Chloroflexota bacterium]
MSEKKYIPALSLKWLTPLYDSLVEGPMSALRMRRDMLSQMGDLSGKRILDVGCGTGTMSIMVKQKYPVGDVVGLDGDTQILEIARSKAEKAGVEIRFEQGMSFDLPYPDGSFDFILTSMMLHHLDRDAKQRTAAEMYRVLRPGGRLIGLDFAEPRSAFGKILRPLTRHLERVDDNLDGFLPIMFDKAGFKNYSETRRYLGGVISLFQASKI